MSESPSMMKISTTSGGCMKKITWLFLIFIVSPSFSQIVNWDNSPQNFKNSELNFENSSQNFKNSPLNFENSPYNSQSKNGVYDNQGRRIGYETQSPSGVTNIFDNDGIRRGYRPSPLK